MLIKGVFLKSVIHLTALFCSINSCFVHFFSTVSLYNNSM